MIYIKTQGTEPEDFIEWRNTHHSFITDQTKTGNVLWHYFFLNGKDERRSIRSTLIAVQGYVCCYCGKRISLERNATSIEHVIPKKLDPCKLTFDYSNMLLACIGGTSIITHSIVEGDTLNSILEKHGVTKEHLEAINANPLNIRLGSNLRIFEKENAAGIHCDKLKDDHVILVHPLIINCFDKFKYSISSSRKRVSVIEYNGCEDTKRTIELVGLNSDILKQLRYRIVQETDKTIEDLVEETQIPEDFFNLLANYQKILARKNSMGYHDPFFFVGLEYLNVIGFKYIDENC